MKDSYKTPTIATFSNLEAILHGQNTIDPMQDPAETKPSAHIQSAENNQISPQEMRNLAISNATSSFRFSFGRAKELSKDQKPKEVKVTRNLVFKDLNSNSNSSGRYGLGTVTAN